jgi:hypothetical protein
MLGPRFEIGSDAKPKFSHTTVQHSIQASIVVPGWTRRLDIAYTASWLDGNGNTHSVGGGNLQVKLPGDDAAITAKLLTASGERRLPFIEPPIDSENKLQVMRLQAQKPGDVLIRGRHLWRNPKVFLGAQPADALSIHPDMNGISAHFNSVAVPLSAKSQADLVLDLSVVTSEGVAILPGAIEIFSGTNSPTQ